MRRRGGGSGECKSRYDCARERRLGGRDGEAIVDEQYAIFLP